MDELKIAILIPYFGNWPDWADLYFYSCGMNDCIDFIFYTDAPLPIAVPQNCRFVQTTLTEYCNMVSDRLGISFKHNWPYKLCDLRPFLGIVHKDDLSGYDFWGYGDIDLVYGDLKSFFYKEKLNEKDMFITSPERVTGHFCLIRNNDKMNNSCFKIPKWRYILEQHENYGIDEGPFYNSLFPYNYRFKRIVQRVFRNRWTTVAIPICRLTNKMFSKWASTKFFETSPRPFSREWEYKDGKIVDIKHNRELPYLHFLFFKKTKYWPENKNYWSGNFYELAPGYNGESLIIDGKGIRYK